jgi:hypothetical protein
MINRTFYLIVPGDGQKPRILSRRPNKVAANEVCHLLRIAYPDGWGRIPKYWDDRNAVVVTLPEPPTIDAEAS